MLSRGSKPCRKQIKFKKNNNRGGTEHTYVQYPAKGSLEGALGFYYLMLDSSFRKYLDPLEGKSLNLFLA
jgi:hypothetical protein